MPQTPSIRHHASRLMKLSSLRGRPIDLICAAALATGQFYRQHGHLPGHQAIAPIVVTALNNPNPIDPSPIAPDPDDQDDLPF